MRARSLRDSNDRAVRRALDLPTIIASKIRPLVNAGISALVQIDRALSEASVVDEKGRVKVALRGNWGKIIK